MYKYIIALFALLSLSNLFSQAPTWESLYKVRPVLSSCTPGELTDTEKAQLLAFTNYIRAIHKMQPLTYMTNGDAAAQAASLIMVANATLTHAPPSNLLCYSQAGFDGAATSNLHIGLRSNVALDYSEDAVIGWLIDDKSASGDQLGHRRAVINPFVNGVAFGRVDGNPKVAEYSSYFATGMAMKYNYYSGSAVGLQNDFVAYPYSNYHPMLFNKDFYLSFSAIPDKSNIWANQDVDFNTATISMKDANGKSIAVSSQKYDNDTWGSMPNNLQWKAAGLVENMLYNVEIKNVKYNGETKNYAYWFKLTEETGEPLAAPTLTSPANNSVDLAQSITLNWGAVSVAESYEVVVADNQEITNILYTQSLSETTFSIDELEKGKTYYWRVRAKKGSDYSEWSSVWQFTTKAADIPAVVTLIAPPNTYTNFGLLGSLEWSKVASAVAYDLQVSSNNVFSNEALLTVNEKNYTDTLYQFEDKKLTAKKMYYWRVRAKFTESVGDWSSVFSFATSNSNSIDDIAVGGAVSDLSIIPNPVQADKFEIRFNSNSEKAFDIMIYSTLGESIMQLKSSQVNIGLNSIPLSASNIINGSYWLVIKDNSGEVYSIRFNVQK